MSLYFVVFLPIHVARFKFEETSAQGLLAYFIVQPGIQCFYLIRKQLADVVDAYVALELFTWVSSLLKKVGPKPDLLKMGFMRIFS